MGVIALIALVVTVTPAWSIDTAAAEQQIKTNNCLKCHAVDRRKDGPAYRDVAAKFRAEAEPERKIISHITSGETVKLPDGHEEHHKKIKTNDQEQLMNVAQWILSLEGGTRY